MDCQAFTYLGLTRNDIIKYYQYRRLKIKKNNLFKSCPLRITFITLLLHCNFYWIVDLKLSFSIIHVMDKTRIKNICLIVNRKIIKMELDSFLFWLKNIYKILYLFYFMKVYFHLATLMTSNYSIQYKHIYRHSSIQQIYIL